MKSRFVALAFLLTAFYIWFNRESYNENAINWDASGYYLYLPGTFIYHDLEKLDYYPELVRKYSLGPKDYYGIYDQPNGNRLNKYAIGTSIFQAPFFFAARLYCQFDKDYPDDGYSKPFSRAHMIGSFVWVFIGLLILGAFLRRYFPDGITAIVLACIGFGTNLYTYGIFQPGMSHPYSFVVVAAILLYTDKWYKTGKPGNALMLGLLLGLATLVRPINIIAVLLPLLWGIGNGRDLQERITFWLRQWKNILLAAIAFIAVLFIQFGYWKFITGKWVVYSYEGEYFQFADSHVWDGLFSWLKGWFVYTPMAILAMAGLFFLWKKNSKLVLAPIVFFVVFTYVVFSWHVWSYGGGFGSRPLIDALPVASLGLAAFTQYIVQQRMAIKAIFFTIMFCFLALNMFQSYQYALGILPNDGMTKETYFRVFGQTKK